jgi:predicted TPR repeat methyltransferase
MNEEAAALLARAYALKDAGAARELYREWAMTYDATMLQGLGYLTPALTAQLLASYVGARDCPVLDIGSGTGLAGAALASHGFTNISALDFSPQMLAVAQSRGVYSRIIEADLTQPLDLPAASHEAMICTGTFTHAHVGAHCLDELFRVLAPGGMFACTVHKDVWRPAGFAAKIASLERAGTIAVLYHRPGIYYRGSQEPDGYYCVWHRKAGS